MSLLNSASPWNSSDNVTKRRMPTMRRTIKMRPSADGEIDEDAARPSSEQAPLSVTEVQSIQEDRGSRVNELINKITAVNGDNGGAHLGDFTPLSPPSMTQQRKATFPNQQGPNQQGRVAEVADLLPANPLQHNVTINRPGSTFSSDDSNLGKLTNYQQSYSNKPVFQKTAPYYAKSGALVGDEKVMERINYMVHLLEEQQHEKTSNVTEEFLLYTLLGVFVIYIVDSFSRTGKYIR
jgi:hypothetical protein